MIRLFNDPLFGTLDSVFENAKYTLGPQTSIRKNESEYKIIMSIPGLSKDDLKILTKEGTLKISFEKQEGDERTHFVTNFVKSYKIPDDVKEKDIVGKVENGVLELTLPIDKKKSLERLISLN